MECYLNSLEHEGQIFFLKIKALIHNSLFLGCQSISINLNILEEKIHR